MKRKRDMENALEEKVGTKNERNRTHGRKDKRKCIRVKTENSKKKVRRKAIIQKPNLMWARLSCESLYEDCLPLFYTHGLHCITH